MPGAVSIALRPPRYYSTSGIPIYENLAPDSLDGDADRYYRKLQQLDPKQVWEESHELVKPHEPVLLCHEHYSNPCHRFMVRDWLESALKVIVDEIYLDSDFIE